MKIGIVGTGTVARDCYLPVLSAEGDIELAYVSRTRAKAEACADTFGGTVFDTLEELLAWQPDSVFVLTNETTRAEVLSELLALKPVRLFLEKPLVARLGQDNVTEEDFQTARELMARAEEIACETAMIFNYRFFDQTLRARELIETRGFGRALQVNAVVNYACWSHAIDLMHHIVGPVETLAALEGATEHRHGDSRARDVTAGIRFVQGATGTIHGTWALNFGFPLYELIINFERGRVHLRGLDGDLEVLDYTSAPPHHEHYGVTRNTSRWDQYKASFGKSIRAYLASLRSADPPPVPGSAGLRELQFEAALRRSARLGRPVDVQGEFPL